MRANIHRQRRRVRALASREHVADLVNTHGAARIVAPFLKQSAAFGVFIRQGLAVVATRNAGADLGHFHQAVPQPVAVDPQVFTGCCHLIPHAYGILRTIRDQHARFFPFG